MLGEYRTNADPSMDGERVKTSIKCIDFGNLVSKLSADEEEDFSEFQRVGEELARSFEDIGFAYILNHGIPQSLIDEAHSSGAKLFALPAEVKGKYSKSEARAQGFVEIDRESLIDDNSSVTELRESFDVCDLDGEFPSEVEGLQRVIQTFTKESIKMANIMLRCLELGLKIKKGTLMSYHQRHFSATNGTALRILHYPPIPEDIKEGAIRCGTHSDYGTFTLLFQDSMGGLEVKTRDGDWIKANPIPGSVLVNVGDLLEFWTSGKFVATKHRVLVPEEEARKRCVRRSIVLFFHPEDDVLVEPFDQSSAYPPILAGQHLKSRFDSTYRY